MSSCNGRGGACANWPRFVHQHNEEYDEVKKARRPGRPATAREDLLRMKIETLEKEHRDGFCKFSGFPAQFGKNTEHAR